MAIIDDNSKNVQDLLGRSKYAESLADTLVSYNSKNSIVVSINEEWGNGKSVVFDYVKQHLEKEHKTEVQIIEFNPWMFKNAEDINKAFFEELKASLNVKSYKNLIEKIAKYSELLDMVSDSIGEPLKKLLNFVSPIIFSISLPFLYPYLEKLPKLVIAIICLGVYCSINILYPLIKTFIEWRKKYYTEKSLLEVKSELSKAIEQSKKKFIFMIDDVDRLDRKEVLALFKLIKLNADFPNFIYLLAFDENVVAKLISEDNFNGHDYIKKIVQISLNLPKIKKEQLRAYILPVLETELKEINKEYSISVSSDISDVQDLFTLIDTLLQNFLTNIRDTKRLVNSFIFNLKQTFYHGETEIYLPDFLAIETIRLFNPRCYRFIRNNKDKFVATENSFLGSQINKPEDIKKEFSTYLNEMAVSKTQLRLLCEIFPYFKGCLENGNGYQAYYNKSKTYKGRIYKREAFDKYFLFSNIDENEIKEYEKKEFFAVSEKQSRELGKFLSNYRTNGRIQALLASVREALEGGYVWKVDNVEEAVKALFECYEKTPNAGRIIEDGLNFVFLTESLLQNQENTVIFEVLEKAFSAAKDLSMPVAFYNIAIEKTYFNTDLSQEQKDKLKNLLAGKLSTQSLADLLNMKDFHQIFISFKAFGLESRRKVILEEIWRSDSLFVRFLNTFIGTSYTVDKGYSFYFDRNSLKNYLDIDRVKERMDFIKDNEPDIVKENQKLFSSFYKPEED